MDFIPSVSEYVESEGFWKIPNKIKLFSEFKQDSFYKKILEQEIFCNKISDKRKRNANIILSYDVTLPKESYVLEVNNRICIHASGEAGVLYALNTLEQLKWQCPDGMIQKCRIQDSPRCAWRGFLLDSGRQYHKVSTIKKYLDMMVMLKMNVFHWHLTEGLGWRIEIKKYPELAKRASCVANGAEQQGYYTQKEIKEIVRYAAERNITIVPEIDVPGHSEAILSVFPQYTCFNKSPEIPKNGFTPSIFCAGKPETLEFLFNIFDEVCELFPSEYIHIGGDEAPKKNWDICPDCRKKIQDEGLRDSHQLQKWFIKQIAAYLKGKNRKVILYCDIMTRDEYAMGDNIAIYWWNYISRKDMPFRKSLELNYEIICGTNEYCYLNFPLVPWEGYGSKRTFDLTDAYTKNHSYVKTENPLVLGMSCALWTDYNVQEYMIDRRLFPRILAISEQMWRKGELRSYAEFKESISVLQAFIEGKGYEFGPAERQDVEPGYKWN